MHKRRDILMMGQFFYPEYVSSAMLPYATACDLVKSGFTVDVICGYPKEYYKGEDVPKKEIINGISIQRIQYSKISRNSFLGKICNYFSFLISASLRIFQLARYKCVIVYTNPPLLPIIPAISRILFGTKFIIVSYDVYPEMALITESIRKNGFIYKLFNLSNFIVYSHMESIVAISNDMRDRYLQKGIPFEKIEVISNFYEDMPEFVDSKIDNLEFREIRKKYKTIVLYSGNMGICQDMDTILLAIESLRDNKDILFAFCGHGVKYGGIKDFVRKKKITNCIFYGFLTGNDFIELQRIADCHLISLIKGLEGFGVPSKAYSYMAAGRVIIAIMGENTDIVRDIKKYNAGFAVNQGDFENLVEIILEIYKNPDVIKKMGQGAREAFLENYTRKECTEKYIKLCNKIIHG